MLTLMLLIFAAVYGFTGASEECETPVSQYCKIHDYNFDAPTTKDALATFCENGKQALECVVSLLRKCKANGDDLSKFREIQANVNDICDEHNILYQVVYENIECIGIALTSAYFGCPQSVEEGMKRVITEKGIASQLEEHSTCSASLYLLSCHVMHTRQLCGKVPGDATLEIYKIFRFPLHCKPEMAAELSTIVETIELVKQEETDFENKLRRK